MKRKFAVNVSFMVEIGDDEYTPTLYGAREQVRDNLSQLGWAKNLTLKVEEGCLDCGYSTVEGFHYLSCRSLDKLCNRED
jgi:hypothetical protein